MPTDPPPQLAWPIRLNAAGSDYAFVAQDSIVEHQQAAALVLSTPVGGLVDNPAFGVPDATFRKPAYPQAIVALLSAALRRWEPRIPAELAAAAVNDRVQTIDATVEG